VQPALRAIATLAGRGRAFDGVFLDPPYHRDLVGPTLAALDAAALVRDGGWVVVEHGRDEESPERVGALVRRDVRRYGDTRVSVFTAAREERSDALA
jgi:16S rRNA G966 N2-methylase RsmD